MRLLAFALLLLPSLGWAAEPSLVVTKAGYYLLSQDANGVPLLTKISKVIDLGKPDDEPEPTPTLTVRAIAVRDAALRATADPKRDETAAKLAELYRQVAKKVRTGELDGQSNISFVAKTGADLVMGQQGLPADSPAWKPMRDAVGGYIVSLAQEGASNDAYAKLLDEAAAGLDASIVNRAAIDQETLKKLIELILQIVMELLLNR